MTRNICCAAPIAARLCGCRAQYSGRANVVEPPGERNGQLFAQPKEGQARLNYVQRIILASPWRVYLRCVPD